MDKKYVQIILPIGVWEACKEVSDKNGMTLAGFIKHLIKKELNQ